MSKPDTLLTLSEAAIEQATKLSSWRKTNRISSLPYEERISLLNSQEYAELLDSQWVESVETPEGTVVCMADIVQRGYNWKLKFSILPVGGRKRKQFSREKAATLLG